MKPTMGLPFSKTNVIPAATESDAVAAQERLVQHELISMLYRDFVWSHTASLVLAVLAVMLLWEDQSALLALGWLGSICIIFIFRWLQKYYFQRAAPKADAIRRWGWFYTIGACASGILWGLLPWFMLDTTSIFNVIYIVMVPAGLIAGAQGVQSFFSSR